LTRYKAKRVKPRCFQERVGHFEPRLQGEGVVPPEYVLVSTKLDTFCYVTVQTAPCYMQSFWHNTRHGCNSPVHRSHNTTLDISRCSSTWTCRTDRQTERQTELP